MRKKSVLAVKRGRLYPGDSSSNSLAFAIRSWAISSSPCEVPKCGHARARRVHVWAISRRYLIRSEVTWRFVKFSPENEEGEQTSDRTPTIRLPRSAACILGAGCRLAICGQSFVSEAGRHRRDPAGSPSAGHTAMRLPERRAAAAPSSAERRARRCSLRRSRAAMRCAKSRHFPRRDSVSPAPAGVRARHR